MRVGYRDMLIALLVIGLVLGVVFGGGVVLGQRTAPQVTPVAAVGGAAGGGAGGAASPGGAQAAGTAGAGAATNPLAGRTIGTITAVQGDSFTVRGQNQQTTTMAASLSTRVTNSVPGSPTDLRPGQTVAIVPGPPDAQGRTIATTVLILPPDVAPAGGTPTAGAGGSATPAR